jgi:hypothetical protein
MADCAWREPGVPEARPAQRLSAKKPTRERSAAVSARCSAFRALMM